MLASHRLIEPLSGAAVVRAGLKASMRLRRIWSQDTDEWPPLPPRNESVHTFNFNDAKREAEPWVSELGPLPEDDA